MPPGSLIKKEIIRVLKENDSEPWYITKLARELPVSATSISIHVRELEEEGKVKTFKREGSRAKYVEVRDD